MALHRTFLAPITPGFSVSASSFEAQAVVELLEVL